MNPEILKLIEEKVNLVEAEHFGEVIIKVKNGVVYRIISTVDEIVDKDQKIVL